MFNVCGTQGIVFFVFHVKLENVTIEISFNLAYCSKSSSTRTVFTDLDEHLILPCNISTVYVVIDRIFIR